MRRAEQPDLLAEVMPAHRRTTVDHIVETLRDMILSGRLPDGAELNQVQLAERFSVSRLPVREALRELQAEGLVTYSAHKRATVTAVSFDELMEVFDVRGRLEAYMIERAVPAFTPAVLAQADDVLRQMTETDDEREWHELHAEFHRVLFTPGGATVSIRLTEQLAARTVRFLYLYATRSPRARPRQADIECRTLLDAFRQGDIDAAKAVALARIERTRERVLATISPEEVAAGMPGH